MGLLYQKKNTDNEEDGKTALFTDFYHPAIETGSTPAKTEGGKGDNDNEENKTEE